MLHAAAGKGTAWIADAVGYHPSAVLKVRHRLRAEGETGLRYHREDNGSLKVTAERQRALVALVGGSPEDYGWARPTWTQELLARPLTQETQGAGEREHGRADAGRPGRAVGPGAAHGGMPVGAGREGASGAGHRAAGGDPAGRGGSVLRRRSGHPPQPADWPGLDAARTAEDGATPGQNEKHYLAGALHPRTGEVFWVGTGRKNRHRFLQLVRRLVAAFPHATTRHVILDNYGIHSSRLVKYALAEELHGRVVLHFPPPYSPKHTRIEHLWRELHANVPRNHRGRTLKDLLRRVEAFPRRVSPYPGTNVSLMRVPRRRAA